MSIEKPYHKTRHPWRDRQIGDTPRPQSPLSVETEQRLRRELIERGKAPRVSAREETTAEPTSVTPKVRAGIHTLLLSFSENEGTGRKFSREENTNVAAVRAWLERTT